MSLEGKRILVGVSGGIAAYKIPSFVRLLKKLGADVRCVMTPASCAFVTPLSLSTVSENPVGIEFFNAKTGEWTNHVEWALWADVMIFAPVTANTLAKMAHGFTDNFLLATYLSAKCPVIVAPAMDLDMYQHPTTKTNCDLLSKMGHIVLEADSGYLASGLFGQGRMPEPEKLVQHVQMVLEKDDFYSSKTILITAGPTYEAIDPVRFIGNHSSGKMGYALAEKALLKGAKVILVLGPSALKIEHPNLELIRVQSAADMLRAVQSHWNKAQIGIFSAAVADYRPENSATQKIKKSQTEMDIKLVKNPDILEWASQHKSTQKVVGFALETQDGLAYAQEKLNRKNLDAIILNEMGEPGVGFGTDTNSVKLLFKNNNLLSFELQSKQKLADSLLKELKNHWYE